MTKMGSDQNQDDKDYSRLEVVPLEKQQLSPEYDGPIFNSGTVVPLSKMGILSFISV